MSINGTSDYQNEKENIMKIVEAYGKVIINGFEFYGQVEQGRFCPQCKSNFIYYDAFDAYF